MGCNFVSMTVDGSATEEQVAEHFRHEQDEDRYYNGHVYSGGMGMATGLTFTKKEFPNADAAHEWLENHAQKWGRALAVRCPGYWVIGANCAV